MCAYILHINERERKINPYKLDIIALQENGTAGRTGNIDGNLQINRFHRPHLMQRRQLLFCTLRVVDFEETRNVFKILTSFTGNNSVLATADGRKITLH